jgi:hypothetical protein
MKQVLLSVLLAGVIASAQAYDLGTVVGSDIQEGKGVFTNLGVNAAAHEGKFSAIAEMHREFKGNTNKYSLLAGYDFAKIGTITFTAKAGAAYVKPDHGTDGYAALAGVGASMPVFDHVSATLDVRHQFGQDRIESVNGNTILVGARYSF